MLVVALCLAAMVVGCGRVETVVIGYGDNDAAADAELAVDSGTVDTDAAAEAAADSFGPETGGDSTTANDAAPDTVEIDAVEIDAATETVPPPSATYCEPWTNPVSSLYFGYHGCCGTFEQAGHNLYPGYLIKGSASVVYYYASNGKRYTFATTNDLESWYAPLDQYGIPTYAPEFVCGMVKEIADTDLAAITIGGLVTIRPGTFITAIATEPETYAISKGHTLRRLVGTDSSMFPEPSLAMRLRFTPDFELVNYLVGTYVYGPADYNRLVELEITIEQDLGILP